VNVIDGCEHDVWSVNTEREYLEEGALDDVVPLLDVVG
jgi:hypothetical protein